MNKYKPHNHFSEDYEEVEVRITAKRIRNNYIMEIPHAWVIDEENKLITICLTSPPDREE